MLTKDKNPTAYKNGVEAEFEIENGVLIKYKGSGGDIEIPDGVTEIGRYAFCNCSSLTGITVPDGVTSIGYGAFEGCDSLKSIVIPNSVTEFGDGAFEDCSGLTSITIPDGVTSIGEGAFDGCGNLASITVDENNSVYCSVDGVLFHKDKRTLICYPAGKADQSYTVPDGVTEIGGYVFYECCHLTNVTIPDSVTEIAPYAFRGCSKLESVLIPRGCQVAEGLFPNGCKVTRK